jgi:hypothetical protein
VLSNFVSELCQIPLKTPVKHGDLRGHSDAHRCCGKLLVGTALMRFDVRQHARAESISKRARSTTPTSLRLESITCERREQCSAKRSFKYCSSAMPFAFSSLRTGAKRIIAKIVSDLLICLDRLRLQNMLFEFADDSGIRWRTSQCSTILPSSSSLKISMPAQSPSPGQC